MPFLDAVHERVVVYDGAIGTNLQLREPTADDFGGPELEGCNEMLVPHPARRHRATSTRRSSRSASTSSRPTPSAPSRPARRVRHADRAHEINLAAARIAREVADDFATDGRPRFVAGSMGPGTKLPSLGQIRFADLRDAYEVQARGLLDGGVDLLLIETSSTCCGQGRDDRRRRAMAAAGGEVPHPGAGHDGDSPAACSPGTEIGAALAALDAMRPDVIGLNCATGPPR